MSGMEALLQLEGKPVSACMINGTYYVAYRRSAVLVNGHPIHIYGSGSTLEEASMDYARKISGKTVVFRDCTEERRGTNVFFIFREVQTEEANPLFEVCSMDENEPEGDYNARS